MLVDGPMFDLRQAGDTSDPMPGSGQLIVVPVEGHVSVRAGDVLLSSSPGESLAIDSESGFTASPGARLLLDRAHCSET